MIFQKKWIMQSMAIFLFFLTALFAVSADLPSQISLQGKLTNTAGVSQVGLINMSFKIYDSYTSGTILYESVQNVTTDSNGVYNTILKNVNLTFDSQYFLGISINADAEATPRINLTSSPYAFRSNSSERLDSTKSYTVANLSVIGNLSVGSRISFSLGQMMENLISGLLRITGSVNITDSLNVSGTVQAARFVGDGSLLTGITGGSTFNNENITLFLGVSNASVIRTENLSSVVRTTNEFNLVNFTANLVSVNSSISLWNISGTNSITRFLDWNVGIGTTSPTKKLSVNGTINAITFDPSASTPTINTTGNNLTISSATGSVIIKLG